MAPPKYTAGLEKENEDENRQQLGEGLEVQRSEKSRDFDDESMFENASEAPMDIPPEAADKIEKLEDQVTKLNQDLKDKNEKLIELLSELEDVKVQVYARDKAMSLQQK